jgi:hypothetical protein
LADLYNLPNSYFMKQSAHPQKARLHRLNIRLDEKEWDKLHKFSANSTCRSVSEYARKVLLAKPVRVFYRNRSFDDFEETMVRILAQMETFGENFKLLLSYSLFIGKIPKLEPHLAPLLECAQSYTRATEELSAHLKKLADQCDQKIDPYDQKPDPCDPK